MLSKFVRKSTFNKNADGGKNWTFLYFDIA